MLYNTVHSIKPWVKFGVSPFGIYHNLSSGGSVPGSDTRGLQNYDDLYADVLFWVGQGWVDYVVPQLYWPIGHSSADYDRLLRWWAKHAAGRPLYIGQDVERTVSKADLNNPTVNQMNAKFELQTQFPLRSGARDLVLRRGGAQRGQLCLRVAKQLPPHARTCAADALHRRQSPEEAAQTQSHVDARRLLSLWTAPKAKTEMDAAKFYVIYCFPKGHKIDINSSTYIFAVTSETMYKLPYNFGNEKYTYVVTALDRLQNESKPVKIKVKL